MSRHRIPRHQYFGALRAPLKVGEEPESKLDLLLHNLGTTSYSAAAALMLERHVIGHNVRDYPPSLRGSPRVGPRSDARVLDAMKHFEIATHRELLLALASRHVPGFIRAKVRARGGGRKNVLGSRGHNPMAMEAELHDLLEELRVCERSGKKLTRLQAARRLLRDVDKGSPLSELALEQIVKLWSQVGRFNKRLYGAISKDLALIREELLRQSESRRK